jgi:hypothetical protein
MQISFQNSLGDTAQATNTNFKLQMLVSIGPGGLAK